MMQLKTKTGSLFQTEFQKFAEKNEKVTHFENTCNEIMTHTWE